MKKARIGVAPEGLPIIALTTLTAICFAMLRWDLLTFLVLVLVWFAVHFFRDPERVVPQGKGLGVSPADGKIIRIAEREDPLSGETKVCVSIFMNVWNVHVNRSPVKGTVTDISYIPGEFFNASWDKSSRDNERCVWRVQDENKKDWVFVQIAGLLARRIVARAEIGDQLERGERFGLIRLGSRVDLYLPQGYEAAVGIGDAVSAGQTVIARPMAEARAEKPAASAQKLATEGEKSATAKAAEAPAPSKSAASAAPAAPEVKKPAAPKKPAAKKPAASASGTSSRAKKPESPASGS